MSKTLTPETLRKLAMKDYWAKTELHFILFGREYPVFHDPCPHEIFPDIQMISPRRLKVEEIIETLDRYIDDAGDKLTPRELTIKEAKKGFSDTNLGIIPLPLHDKYRYGSLGLLRLLRDKEYPVPDRLIESIEEKKWDLSVEAFCELNENMVYLLDHGENPPATRKPPQPGEKGEMRDEGKKLDADTAKQIDPDEFVKNLLVFRSTGSTIFIKPRGALPKEYTAHSLDFQSERTKEWNNFINILNDGKFSYGKNKNADKQLYKSIEKKLLEFFNAEFKIVFPSDFKLFASSRQEAKKIFQPKFKINKTSGQNTKDYSKLNLEQISKELKLAATDENRPAEDYIALEARAKELGMSENKITEIISSDKNEISN